MSNVVTFTPRGKLRHILTCNHCGSTAWKIAKTDASGPLQAECANCEELAIGIEVDDTN